MPVLWSLLRSDAVLTVARRLAAAGLMDAAKKWPPPNQVVLQGRQDSLPIMDLSSYRHYSLVLPHEFAARDNRYFSGFSNSIDRIPHDDGATALARFCRIQDPS